MILRPDAARERIERFNREDNELYANAYPNAQAWDFLCDRIPHFDCPEPDLTEIYYFRWWTYRKHLRHTPEGWVVTEFLPDVNWAGKHNTIVCAAAHHFYEGRWLRAPEILDDYARFWFRGGGSVHDYAFWAADSILNRALVTGSLDLPLELLPDFVRLFEGWEHGGWPTPHPWVENTPRRDGRGLFWQIDTSDGMEFSIGGHGYRPSFNSYIFADARAIAALARQANQPELARTFAADADTLKRLVQETLWDPQLQFFVTYVNEAGAQPHYDWQQFAPHIYPAGARVDVREAIGFVPWAFNLPDAGYEAAWAQLTDPAGFRAPYGPTTAEQRHRNFRYAHTHDCLWNGESWPFATTQTLVALANLLNNYTQTVVTARDYLDLLLTYARSQTLPRPDGLVQPWLDENLDPYTGEWAARAKILARKPDPNDPNTYRGQDYNHSAFCDLVITGLVGLRPRPDNLVEVNPLAPSQWDFFCLDRIPYHGRDLTLLWDRTGNRYNRGRGLSLLVDGTRLAHREMLGRLTVELPA